MVMDPSDGEVLGRFIITSYTKGSHLAREERILNAIWWGALHQEIDKHIRPRINAVAILLPEREEER